MVSGMLTAIRDFVQDSFKCPRRPIRSRRFKVGELVGLDRGRARTRIVAAVIRGSAPRDFRHALQEAVESIHLQFGEALEAFNGDTAPLADARPTLEALPAVGSTAPMSGSPRTRSTWIVAGVDRARRCSCGAGFA